MLAMLPLCLLLVVQFCAASSVDCDALVYGIDVGDHTVVTQVVNNWEQCRSVFLDKEKPERVDMLVENLKEVARSITARDLEQLIRRDDADISSKFFAMVPDVSEVQGGAFFGRRGVSENILEYYDGPVGSSWSRMSAEQFNLFGSKLPKDFVCQEVNIESLRDMHLRSISLRCLRGLLRTPFLDLESRFRDLWRNINSRTRRKWLENLSEESETLPVSSYKYLPEDTWRKVLKSPELMERIQDTDQIPETAPIYSALMSIGHVQFAKVVKRLPLLSSTFVKYFTWNLPPDIFASCRKTEMALFHQIYIDALRVFEERPDIIHDISSALEDEQHLCYDLDPDMYRQLHWLRIYGSERCRKLVVASKDVNLAEFPELTNDVELWKLQIEAMKGLQSGVSDNAIILLKSRKGFCELLAKEISSEELAHLKDKYLNAIGHGCAFKLRSLLTAGIASKLGYSAFRLFTTDEFLFKLNDLSLQQIADLSTGVREEDSAFTKIGMDELLSYGDRILSYVTEYQVKAIRATQEQRNWIEFRCEAARLADEEFPVDSKPFSQCLGMENKECLDILAQIVAGLSENRQRDVGDIFKSETEFRSMGWELLSGVSLLDVISRDQFDGPCHFVVEHDGQKYNLEKSLNIIKENPESLANPISAISLSGAYGDGPTRAWIEQLDVTMKNNMISDYSDYDASIQKFKFPIKGGDGFVAAFLMMKTLQNEVTLPFALDPKFYELAINADDEEITLYFKETYANELETFRATTLCQNLTDDYSGLAPEQKEQVKQIEQDQSKTPEERAKAIEKIKNVEIFNRIKEEGDFMWAPLDELTFNGFESNSNYDNYATSRGDLTFEEWDAKGKAVYSEFDYDSTGEYYEQFYERCLSEFKDFVKNFRSGLGFFFEMPDTPVTRKESFSALMQSRLDPPSQMTAEGLLQKITWAGGEPVNSWYGRIDASIVFKTFVKCLNPKQLSKLVAVWTGAASMILRGTPLKVAFYQPNEGDIMVDSYMMEEQNESVSSSVVIHGGAEYKEFVQRFSERLGQEANATETIDPFSDGEEHPKYWPSVGSQTCFKNLRVPIQHSRGMVEALIYLLNDDPSNLKG